LLWYRVYRGYPPFKIADWNFAYDQGICGPGAEKHDSDSDQCQRMYKYQYIISYPTVLFVFLGAQETKKASKNHKKLLSHALARSFRKSLDLFIR